MKKQVRKVPVFVDEDEELMNESDNLKSNLEQSTSTEYIINAVIKKKILFNKRPRPIVYIESKKI